MVAVIWSVATSSEFLFGQATCWLHWMLGELHSCMLPMVFGMTEMCSFGPFTGVACHLSREQEAEVLLLTCPGMLSSLARPGSLTCVSWLIWRNSAGCLWRIPPLQAGLKQ